MTASDIRLEGRRWTREELVRHDALPGRLEMVCGKLCLDDAQRMLLLEALLEHVGTARAVSLGPLEAWANAVNQRRQAEASDVVDVKPTR